MTEKQSDFPVGYHIGAPLAGASRRSYFRPSQPTDLLFPGIGMIFHDIFWIKHVLYCVKKDYKVLNRDTNHLDRLAYFFIPVNIDDTIKLNERVKDSILFTLLMIPENVEIDSFSNWATGDGAWLFREKGWVNDLKAKISSWAENLDEQVIISDINHILGGGLRSQLNAIGIDIDQEIKKNFIKRLQDDMPIDREKITIYFCSLIWEFVNKVGHLRYNPIYENIAFVEERLFPRPDFDVNNSPHLTKVANRDFKGDTGYSEDEKEALLLSLEATKYGTILLESIILTDVLVSICKNDLGNDGEAMRNAYENLVKQETEIKTFIKDNYSSITSDFNKLFDRLLVRALAWEWNLFLLDGEHIIKDILFNRLTPEGDGLPLDLFDMIIVENEKTIKKELSSLGLDPEEIDEGIFFCNKAHEFLMSLKNSPKKFEKFKTLFESDQGILSEKVQTVLKMNVELINKTSPQDIFRNYIQYNGNYEITSDRIRLIDDSDVSVPFMAGFGAYISWFNTLRRGPNGGN